MDILSPISTMSSFFDTIEECKEENENGTQKLVQERPFVSETKADEESSWQNNNRKSIFSLSHIINAFGNNSFFNLKEIGSLTKIIDSSTIVDTNKIDTKQENTTAKENENEKEKKERKNEKSEFLTLHIVGIRSIDNKTNGSKKNDKNTIDSFISEICPDAAAATGGVGVGGDGLNERKEIDFSESKTDSHVAGRIAIVGLPEVEESSSEMKGAGMFADDDSSSSSSDNEPLLRVNNDVEVESSSEMKGNIFGDCDSDSESDSDSSHNDNNNDDKNENGRIEEESSSCVIPIGMWGSDDSSNEENENETDNRNNNNNNNNNENKESEEKSRNESEEEESSDVQGNIFGGDDDDDSSSSSDDSANNVFAQREPSRSSTPASAMFGGGDDSTSDSSDDDDDDDEPRIVAVRRERQERQRRQVTPVAPPTTATNNETVNNEDEKKTDNKTVFAASTSELCLKTINTNLTGNSTVKELKDYLRNNESFELDKYLIIEFFYSNICLDDEYRTLGYYGIVNNSFLLACVYEGLPLRKDDYEWEIQQIQRVIDGDKPSKFVSSYQANDDSPASSINNGNTIDLLTAFTRRHVTNVQRGVTGESLAQANERRHMAEAKSEEREESKWHEIDFQEMSNDFKMEKISCLDVVTFMEEDNCVKMPCGHGMHPESLLAYILSEVNAQNTMDFYCPHLMKDEKTGSEKLCRAKWHYPIIKKVLLYAMNEEIERAILEVESDEDVCIVAPESMIHCDGDPIKRGEDNNIELSSKRHAEIFGNLDVKPLTEDALLLYGIKKKEIENKYLLNFMKIELLIARNILQEKFDAQTCGNCHSVLFRRISKKAMSMSDFQSVCPICTKEHRKQLIAENDIKIEKLRAKIAKLEKPKIVRTIKKVHKNLTFSKLSRRVRRLQNRLHRKKQNIHESLNNIKSKFDIKRYFNDSIEDIESKSLKYNELKSINSKQHRLHHHRRGRKRRRENDVVTSSVLTTVPTSFLDAFRDENDSSSSDDDRDNYLDAIEAREKARAKAIRHEKFICKLKDIREKRIINPYLDCYDDLLDINMFGDNDIESPSEYDYVSDGYCSSASPSPSMAGHGLFDSDSDSDSDSSSAPIVNLFDNDNNDNDSSDCNDVNVFNDDDTLLSSDDSSESISVHMSDDEKNNNNNGRAGNGYVFENDDNNNNGYSSSESESEGTQARRNIFNGNSSESESDNEEEKNGKSKEEADSVKAVIKVKTEEEMKLERLKYELNYLVSRSFDNVKYSKYFCWGCGIAWKDVLSPSCGNSECHSSFRAQISSILRECDTKKVGSQSNVPSVRGCPKCGQLIHHWDACKHMECTQCQSYFCFVCLKRYVQDKGGWQCGSYSDKCPSGVHKRQTIDDLPSLNVATVKLFDFKAI